MVTPVRRAARFVTKMRELRNADPENTFVVFSGDAFNPSLISSVSKGTQMVPCLNALNIDVALFGATTSTLCIPHPCGQHAVDSPLIALRRQPRL